MKEERSEIIKKLAMISEVMADAYYFMNVFSFVNEWDKMAKNGDPMAQEMLSVIERFHRMCVLAKGKKT